LNKLAVEQVVRLLLVYCLTFLVLAGCGRTVGPVQPSPTKADEPPVLTRSAIISSPTFTANVPPTTFSTATPSNIPPPTLTPEPKPLSGPNANLLINPTCNGRHGYIPDDWTSVPSEEMWWTVSWKESNPPFEADSTACRWAQVSNRNDSFDPSGHVGYIYQVVAANPELATLEFSGWWTSNNLIRFAVLVDGAESPAGPWAPVGVAFESTVSTDRQWVEIPLRSVAIEQSWPYYRFGLFCHYQGGSSGCKATLLHFGLR
jgi:hypothetical protein